MQSSLKHVCSACWLCYIRRQSLDYCLPPQVRQLPKKQFKKKVLFTILHAKETYVEAPTFLLKMAKYVN